MVLRGRVRIVELKASDRTLFVGSRWVDATPVLLLRKASRSWLFSSDGLGRLSPVSGARDWI